MTLRVALTAKVLVLCVLSVNPAAAHDPHPGWMQEPQYKYGKGEPCCSPDRDCRPISDSDLEMTSQGWKYLPTGEIISKRSTFSSQDTTHWRCEGTIDWLVNVRQPSKTRCLFIAPRMS
jgi:hypothetical protein